MHVIRSTALRAIGYDPRTRRLTVQFRKDGSVWIFFGVAPSLYAALLWDYPQP